MNLTTMLKYNNKKRKIYNRKNYILSLRAEIAH